MEDDNPYSGLNFTSQTYNVLDDAMVKMYENNEYKESARLAAQLLTKADLPTLIRARCHMMLSLKKNSPLAVQHAEAAVEILDVEARKLVLPEAFPQQHLNQALECLKMAKQDAALQQAEQQEDEPIARLPSLSELQSISKADKLALKEAASALGSAAATHGLITPGASRTHSGPSGTQAQATGRQTRTRSSGQQPPLPTPKKEREDKSGS